MKRSYLGFGLAVAVAGVLVSPASAFAASRGNVSMWRLYNPYSGEHFYTSSIEEVDSLTPLGWRNEDVGWVAPVHSNTPVYRLYNSHAPGGDHHYTTSRAEYDALVKAGWTGEDIGWYSDDGNITPVYREYNPNAYAHNHNFTTDLSEHNTLVGLGWKNESAGGNYAWFGLARTGHDSPRNDTERNALRTAQDYVSIFAFSRSRLVNQLEYEKFSSEVATWAADYSGADWYEQALLAANNYLEMEHGYSYKGLFKQLSQSYGEAFAEEEAAYALNNCGADWNKQAVLSAKSYLKISSYSRDRLVEQLEFEEFTHEQAVYGVDHCGAKW